MRLLGTERLATVRLHSTITAADTFHLVNRGETREKC
jgi:hypothetical protein